MTHSFSGVFAFSVTCSDGNRRVKLDFLGPFTLSKDCADSIEEVDKKRRFWFWGESRLRSIRSRDARMLSSKRRYPQVEIEAPHVVYDQCD